MIRTASHLHTITSQRAYHSDGDVTIAPVTRGVGIVRCTRGGRVDAQRGKQRLRGAIRLPPFYQSIFDFAMLFRTNTPSEVRCDSFGRNRRQITPTPRHSIIRKTHSLELSFAFECFACDSMGRGGTWRFSMR